MSIERFDPIKLGNVDAKRDWSDAEDFMSGVWAMLNQDKDPKQLQEYVLASGETHTVKEFLEEAFKAAKVDIYDKEGNIDPKFVEVDPKLFRPAEVTTLTGDPSRAKQELGWEPKSGFVDLVKKMVHNDLKDYD